MKLIFSWNLQYLCLKYYWSVFKSVCSPLALSWSNTFEVYQQHDKYSALAIYKLMKFFLLERVREWGQKKKTRNKKEKWLIFLFITN